MGGFKALLDHQDVIIVYMVSSNIRAKVLKYTLPRTHDV